MTLNLYLILLFCLSGVASPEPAIGSSDFVHFAQATNAITVGRIKGVVTYRFNANYGDKPDTGAKVFLIAGPVDFPADSAAFFYKDSVHLLLAPELAELNSSIRAHTKPPLLGKMFPLLDNTAVDANGTFSLDAVNPGSYTVIIQSSHSVGRDSRDLTGRIKCVSVEVVDGRSIDASWNFLPSAI